MRQNDNNEHLKIRNPGRPDEAGVALPKRLPGGLFPGWGPKLMGAALAIGALALSNQPAKAASACENHAAMLVGFPAFGIPEGAVGGKEAVLRVDLSANGRVQNLALAQSSGDALLDLEAMRIVHQSRYAAAVIDCKPAADSFLYRVTFNN